MNNSSLKNLLESEKHTADTCLLIHHSLSPKNPLEPENRTSDTCPLGLENIPIIDSEAFDENKIEFSFSTPTKVKDLSPILAKWSPKIHDVVSIVEEVIETDEDEDDLDIDDKSDETEEDDHIVYVDEDAVKQEEFVDENADENFELESNKSFKKIKEEWNNSFDEHKIKQEYNITDNLSIKLEKIINYNPDEHDSPIKRVTRSEVSRENNAVVSSAIKKKLSKKSSNSSRSAKSKKSSRDRHRSRMKLSNNRIQQKPSSNQVRQKPSNNQTQSKPSNNLAQQKPTNNHVPQKPANNQVQHSTQQKRKQPCQPSRPHRNKRQSLRLSGRSPELKLPEEVPSITRSGKKRIYEEPKSRAKDLSSASFGSNSSRVKNEPENDTKPRPRSLSPSTYRKRIDIMYVCQCCDQKYLLLEQIKTHVRTHFPNIATS